MRNLVIDAIHALLDQGSIHYPKPLHQHSNKELLELYTTLLIEIETEEYD